MQDLYTRSRGEGFGQEVKKRILVGTFALSAGYYDAFYGRAQKVRRLIKQDFVEAFSQVDIIAGPTTPTPAFGLGEKANPRTQGQGLGALNIGHFQKKFINESKKCVVSLVLQKSHASVSSATFVDYDGFQPALAKSHSPSSMASHTLSRHANRGQCG